MNTQLYKDLINEKEYFDYINKKKIECLIHVNMIV